MTDAPADEEGARNDSGAVSVDDAREGGAVFESGGPEGPIEPGEPTLEGTVFVLLGALIACGAVVRLWLLFN